MLQDDQSSRQEALVPDIGHVVRLSSSPGPEKDQHTHQCVTAWSQSSLSPVSTVHTADTGTTVTTVPARVTTADTWSRATSHETRVSGAQTWSHVTPGSISSLAVSSQDLSTFTAVISSLPEFVTNITTW